MKRIAIIAAIVSLFIGQTAFAHNGDHRSGGAHKGGSFSIFIGDGRHGGIQWNSGHRGGHGYNRHRPRRPPVHCHNQRGHHGQWSKYCHSHGQPHHRGGRH